LIVDISLVKGIMKKPLLGQLVRKIVQKEQLNQTQNPKITSIQKCQTIYLNLAITCPKIKMHDSPILH